jgi:hypothetical protein
MKTQRVIALLGRRDQPTDAVEEYCRYLGAALDSMGFELELRRVPWDEHGWSASLNALKLQAEKWSGTWVLLQYTSLAWSKKGFPRRVLSVVSALRSCAARVAVVFHDAEPFGGPRLIDRIRRSEQLRVMRALQDWADCSVFTIPTTHITWLTDAGENVTFIPVGANLLENVAVNDHANLHSPPAVAVYGITGGAAGERELGDILASVRVASAKVGQLRLLVFGRNADVHEIRLREGLANCSVEIQVEGVIPDTQLVTRFSDSDVQLFVRGTVSSRRGSAIAGIVSGLPVIAFRGSETAAPVTEAGVVLIEEDRDDAKRQKNLGDALIAILTNRELRNQLVRQNVEVAEKFFSWQAIAARYAQFLTRASLSSDR